MRGTREDGPVTTLAWDGMSLAADRQSTYNGTKYETRKIRDCSAWIYAGCGSKDAIEFIAQWLTAGANAAERPMIDEDGLMGIAIRKSDGRAFLVEGKRPILIEVHAKRWALGSGSDFALSAMELGKSAFEAVRFAARFDVGTGMGVDSIRIKVKKRSGQ